MDSVVTSITLLDETKKEIATVTTSNAEIVDSLLETEKHYRLKVEGEGKRHAGGRLSSWGLGPTGG